MIQEVIGKDLDLYIIIEKPRFWLAVELAIAFNNRTHNNLLFVCFLFLKMCQRNMMRWLAGKCVQTGLGLR